MSKLFGVGQTIQSHILEDAGTVGIIKGIGQRGLGRHLAPYRARDIGSIAVDRQTVLITLETIFEDVLANLTEVEI